MLTVSSLSLQYVKLPVAATVNGAAYNPTGDTVQFAFIASSSNPQTTDWKNGSWETVGSTYYARILIGTGGAVALAPGIYDVWIKVSDNPEIPVKMVDTITIT